MNLPNPERFQKPLDTAASLERPAADAGLLLARVAVGGLFVFHGSAKFTAGIDGFAGYLDSLGVPFPTLNAYLAAGTEVVAGLALALGLFTRLAALPLAFTMAVAFFTAKGAALSAQGGGGEYPLALGLFAIALALTGPGRASVDHALRTAWGKLSLAVRRPSHAQAPAIA
ncbi:MAG: DoxX family protein [Planctomycetota bacterium]